MWDNFVWTWIFKELNKLLDESEMINNKLITQNSPLRKAQKWSRQSRPSWQIRYTSEHLETIKIDLETLSIKKSKSDTHPWDLRRYLNLLFFLTRKVRWHLNIQRRIKNIIYSSIDRDMHKIIGTVLRLVRRFINKQTYQQINCFVAYFVTITGDWVKKFTYDWANNDSDAIEQAHLSLQRHIPAFTVVAYIVLSFAIFSISTWGFSWRRLI